MANTCCYKKVNKLPNDNIHRPNVMSSRKNKTTASTKNPQTRLNRNSFLIFGTHTHSMITISCNFNVLYIIIFNVH